MIARPLNAPNVLLVEGNTEQMVIPELMEANGVLWPRATPPVHIEDCKSIDQLLHPSRIKLEVQSEATRRLGIVLDADNDPMERWKKIANRLTKYRPDFPAEPRPEGTIMTVAEGPTVGIWMMPNNTTTGMLETMLVAMANAQNAGLLAFAGEQVLAAKSQGARYKQVHLDKAHIHTWLAWQDPPGEQLHRAIQNRVLDPQSAASKPFVDWFKRLFEL